MNAFGHNSARSSPRLSTTTQTIPDRHLNTSSPEEEEKQPLVGGEGCNTYILPSSPKNLTYSKFPNLKFSQKRAGSNVSECSDHSPTNTLFSADSSSHRTTAARGESFSTMKQTSSSQDLLDAHNMTSMPDLIITRDALDPNPQNKRPGFVKLFLLNVLSLIRTCRRYHYEVTASTSSIPSKLANNPQLKRWSRRKVVKIALLGFFFFFAPLLVYTITIRNNDAKLLNRFLSDLDGVDGSVMHSVRKEGVFVGEAVDGPVRGDDHKCYFSYDFSPSTTTKEMLGGWNVLTPPILSTIIIRICRSVPEQSILGLGLAPSSSKNDVEEKHDSFYQAWLQTFLLDFWSSKVAPKQFLVEIVKGAHVVVKGDSGAYYEWLKDMDGLQKRSSSHFSVKQQYALKMGKTLQTLLFGINHDGDTWFQLEGREVSGWKGNWVDSSIHIINFVEYKISGNNVGPLGSSRWTESEPLYSLFDGCGYAGGNIDEKR
ncbi:hypothetical protein TrVE_jg961 [Triparma verrucosa]|uniref:Uncharacterized protein n=1 Tax=Triparma verrucosa TaxID=1606542 RepID=A0A9W7KVH3_9STRA|nr:hypothetical protein TrVE_jg961 [Triparma verrucosa]